MWYSHFHYKMALQPRAQEDILGFHTDQSTQAAVPLPELTRCPAQLYVGAERLFLYSHPFQIVLVTRSRVLGERLLEYHYCLGSPFLVRLSDSRHRLVWTGIRPRLTMQYLQLAMVIDGEKVTPG